MKRTAYFISDSTGITAETLGNSLLTQFSGIQFDKYILPYVDDDASAKQTVEDINFSHQYDDHKPVIFISVVKKQIRDILHDCDGLVLDVFSNFLSPMSDFFGQQAAEVVGNFHSTENKTAYDQRINAMNYALDNDDGCRFTAYDTADVILLGVSRSGKTPSCLFLGLHYGICAANYPLTPDDLENGNLPSALKPHQRKLFGLTIEPDRLADIREQRKANSQYASITQCEDEVRMAEHILKRYKIPYLNTTNISVEEIATRIRTKLGLQRTL